MRFQDLEKSDSSDNQKKVRLKKKKLPGSSEKPSRFRWSFQK